MPVLVLSSSTAPLKKITATPNSPTCANQVIEQDADVVLMLARPRDADEKFQVAADSAS